MTHNAQQISALDKLFKSEKSSVVTQFVKHFEYSDGQNDHPTKITVSSGLKGFSGVRTASTG